MIIDKLDEADASLTNLDTEELPASVEADIQAARAAIDSARGQVKALQDQSEERLNLSERNP